MRYLSVIDVVALHEEIMARYGQESLLRGGGLGALESALLRPQTAAHYEGADLARQAALLIIGLAVAHPFVDGNKRIGFAAGVVMLRLNGYTVQSNRQEFARRIVDVLSADDRSDESIESFAQWIGSRMEPLGEI